MIVLKNCSLGIVTLILHITFATLTTFAAIAVSATTFAGLTLFVSWLTSLCTWVHCRRVVIGFR